jgi:hypothetical protein
MLTWQIIMTILFDFVSGSFVCMYDNKDDVTLVIGADGIGSP